MSKPGPWSCREAEKDALAHPEKIKPFSARKAFTEKTLRQRAEKWAGCCVKVFMAGYKAGKKDGYKAGLWEGYKNHELYQEKVTK